jgi:phage shock protein A
VTESPQQPPEPVDAEIVPGTPVPVPPVQPPATDYDEHSVPTLDYVRDKIEGRYATSIGSTELAEGSAEARSLEEQQAERERAAKARLEEIRRSLGR